MPERFDAGTCCLVHLCADGRTICAPASAVAPDGSLGHGVAYISPGEPEYAEWRDYLDRRDRPVRRPAD